MVYLFKGGIVLTEAKAMAYVNMYGVLATLENLCEIDAEAKDILAAMKSPVSLCFDVANGPCGTFHFTKGVNSGRARQAAPAR